MTEINTGTHKNGFYGWKTHAWDFIFCGYVCLLEPSCWKRHESRGSIRVGNIRDRCKEQWRRLINIKKLTCSRVGAFCFWSSWTCKCYKNMGLEGYLGSWPGTGGAKKHHPGPHINLRFFFPKFGRLNSYGFFWAMPKISACLFFGGWARRGLWSRNHCKDRYLGSTEGLHKKGPRRDGGKKLTSGPRHLVEWTAFRDEKKSQ